MEANKSFYNVSNYCPVYKLSRLKRLYGIFKAHYCAWNTHVLCEWSDMEVLGQFDRKTYRERLHWRTKLRYEYNVKV